MSTSTAEHSSACEQEQADTKHLRQIYVGNLDLNTSVRDVWRRFAPCGQIVRVNVQALRRFAFVEFAEASSVEIGLTLSGASIRRRPIFVTRVTPKVRRREHHIVDVSTYPVARIEGSTDENEHQHNDASF